MMVQGSFLRICRVDVVPQNCGVAARSPPRRRRSHARARLSYFVHYDGGRPLKSRASASSATPAEASSEEKASLIDALRSASVATSNTAKSMMSLLSSGLPVFDSNLRTCFGLQEHHASRHRYARQHGPDAVGTTKTSRKDRYPGGDRGGRSPLRVRPAVEPQMALRTGSRPAKSARGQ